MSASKKTALKGRPPTGNAKTSTERGKSRDAALIESGGKIVSRLHLSASASESLASLSVIYGGNRAAIEAAIFNLDAKTKGPQ